MLLELTRTRLTAWAQAGLTLGLMGLDPLHLRVLKTSSDDERERHHATKVLRLLNRGRHWVLVVLLLGNVVRTPLRPARLTRLVQSLTRRLLPHSHQIVNESLPIFLDSILGGGIAAVVASTVLIVIFGWAFSVLPTLRPPQVDRALHLFLTRSEIIPQSVGVRYGLAIGSFSAPFVLTLMFLTSPISYPIAKLLDWVLGANEDHTYKKAVRAFRATHVGCPLLTAFLRRRFRSSRPSCSSTRRERSLSGTTRSPS